MFRACRLFRALLFLLLLAGGSTQTPAGAAEVPPTSRTEPSNEWTPAETWAWSRIENSEAANFDERQECKGESAPKPKDKEAAGWQDDCRKISHRFLENLLTRTPWREATPIAGVNVAHARIVGEIDLENATLMRQLGIFGSRIEGAINLTRARSDSLIVISDSLITGKFIADGFHSESDLFLRYHSVFEKPVILRGAEISGRVDMIGASFDDVLDADSVRVGAALLMRSEDQYKTNFKEVILRGANITGQVDMSGASFERELSFESLHVDGDLFLRNVHAGSIANIVMTFAHIDGNIDLRSTNLVNANINLSGASARGEFRVGKLEKLKDQSSSWTLLNLRNAHVGYLTDTKDAWPESGQLILDGFTFDHLGALKDGSATPTPRHDMAWWDRWAKRDPAYSPAPYAQLATALKNAGDNEAANEIRYLGRERAREKICGEGTSFDCLFQNFLGYAVGYGIGRYTFLALF